MNPLAFGRGDFFMPMNSKKLLRKIFGEDKKMSTFSKVRLHKDYKGVPATPVDVYMSSEYSGKANSPEVPTLCVTIGDEYVYLDEAGIDSFIDALTKAKARFPEERERLVKEYEKFEAIKAKRIADAKAELRAAN